MIFAQTTGYRRRRNAFTVADYEGAAVAHQDLLRAVIEYADVDAVHLFLDSYNSAGQQAMRPALDELRQDFPDKIIEVKRTKEFSELVSSREYVFSASGIDFQPLIQARLAIPGANYPVCALLHAIDLPYMLPLYVSTLLLAEPYDTIVATSRSGALTIENMLRAAGDLLHVKFCPELNRGPRIVQIPLGVDDRFLKPRDKQPCRELFGLPESAVVILYLGRLSEEQKADLEPLFVAVREIANRKPTTYLVIAGQDVDGVYARKLEGLAISLGIAKSVKFITNFPYFLKPALYSAADIFVSPADNIQETFGLSVIEAMACGLPVVASDWSGYRDLVENTVTGFLIRTLWSRDAADTLSTISTMLHHDARRVYLAQRTIVDPVALRDGLDILVDNPDLRKQFGENGRTHVVKKFSWPVVVRQHQELWRTLCAEARAESRSAKPSLLQDYNKLFSHYAAQVIDENVRVVRSGRLRGLDELHSKRTSRELDTETQQVLERVRSGPIQVKELLNLGGHSLLDNILWLLKKGYIEVENPIQTRPTGDRGACQK